MKRILDFTWRAAILTVVFAVVQAVVAGAVFKGSDLAKAMQSKGEIVSGASEPAKGSAEPGGGVGMDPAQAKAAGMFLLVAMVEAVVVSLFVRTLAGPWYLKVVLAITAYFGLDTFMQQMETAYYWSAFSALTRGDLGRFFVRGIIVSLVFVPTAILVNWSRRGMSARLPKVADFSGAAWKIPAIGVIYVLIYFLFGYFVAWQFGEVRRFYTGTTDLMSFFPHMASAFRDRPTYVPFQFMRGILWAGFGLSALYLMRGRRAALLAIVAAMFALLPTVQLAYPNPLMPPSVRAAHFLETVTSMALFGVILGLMFTESRLPVPARRKRRKR